MNASRPIIIQNAIYIPEEDVYLKSCHVHDCVFHNFKDGKSFMIDGGTDYMHWTYDPEMMGTRVIDWCLYDTSSRSEIMDKILWGTYGKDGKGPLRYRPVKILEIDHLGMILKIEKIHPLIKQAVEFWLHLKSNPRMVKDTNYKAK